MIELTVREFAIVGFMAIGVTLMLIAALGTVRMPDLYLRTSVSSKGATLGVAALLLAAALSFADIAVAGRALAIIVFMFLTAPVAAHLLGRAAYRSDVGFWSETQLDRAVESLELQRHFATTMPTEARKEEEK